jgi:hypothetical protein
MGTDGKKHFCRGAPTEAVVQAEAHATAQKQIGVQASLATGPSPSVSRRFRCGYPSKSSFTTTYRDGYPIGVIGLTATPQFYGGST